MEPLRTLVTGGTGFVGLAVWHVIHQSNQRYHSGHWVFASSRDADLRDRSEVIKLFNHIRPHRVLHLAANCGGLYKNLANRWDMWADNIRINLHVMEACRQYQVAHVVSCMSTCIFPDGKFTSPMTEQNLHQGPPHHSNAGYAYAKRSIDWMNQFCQEDFSKINHLYQAAIPTNIYGPHDHFNLDTAHVIPMLICKALKAKSSHKPLVVCGSGEPLRQFIHVDDVAHLLVWMITRHTETSPGITNNEGKASTANMTSKPQSIILAPDPSEEISIRTLAHTIADVCEIDAPVVFDTNFADGQYRKTVSNGLLRQLLPNYRFISLQEGISQTVKWYLQQHELK